MKPIKKASPKGKDCECGAFDYGSCGCNVSWDNNDPWNDCVDAYDAHVREAVPTITDLKNRLTEACGETGAFLMLDSEKTAIAIAIEALITIRLGVGE